LKIILLSLGMMVVTYVPRLLPLVALGGRRIPEKLKSFLSYIPYAAMGALIIPGGMGAIEGSQTLSLIGMGAALVASWFSRSIILTVAVSIASVYLLYVIL